MFLMESCAYLKMALLPHLKNLDMSHILIPCLLTLVQCIPLSEVTDLTIWLKAIIDFALCLHRKTAACKPCRESLWGFNRTVGPICTYLFHRCRFISQPHMTEEAWQGEGIVPILTQSSARRLGAGPWLTKCSPQANPLRITCDR